MTKTTDTQPQPETCGACVCRNIAGLCSALRQYVSDESPRCMDFVPDLAKQQTPAPINDPCPSCHWHSADADSTSAGIACINCCDGSEYQPDNPEPQTDTPAPLVPVPDTLETVGAPARAPYDRYQTVNVYAEAAAACGLVETDAGTWE